MSTYRNVAERIYDLDFRVHQILETQLGRVFTDEREICIQHLIEDLKASRFFVIRNDMALIHNMIRTIEDRQQRCAMMDEYHAIFHCLQNLPKEIGVVEIQDEHAAELSGSALSGKFDPRKKRIICIGRQYGSAGTDIGFLLAEKLNMSFYDGEIFDAVGKRLEVEQDTEADYLLDPNLIGKKGSSEGILRRIFRYHGLSRKDAFFFNQSELICEMADKESFVIIGRCADMILNRKNIPHFNIFIGAPLEQRVQRTMAQQNLDHKHAKRLVKQMDRRHRKYYNYYTMKKWGAPMNYDLCINSATYGIEGTVNLIYDLVTAKQEDMHLEVGTVSLEDKLNQMLDDMFE